MDDIFDKVQAVVKTGALAENLTIDLLEAAEHYVALDSPDDAVWSEYSPKTRDKIRSLRLLDSRQVRPVIMSAIKRFSVAEFEKLVWLLEVITVRWQLIGGKRTGAIEISCAKLAFDIWKNKITTATQARAALDSIYTSNDDFRASFTAKEGLTNTKAVYLLKMIEVEERRRQLGNEAPELSPGQYLTLEHILPKNPSADWDAEIAADKDLSADYTLRLGNACLLTEPRNREAAQKGFETKKKLYADSVLLSTARIAEYDTWTRDAIQHNQVWLASRAADIWSY